MALDLASHLLVLGKKADDKVKALIMLQKAIADGSGIKKFKELVAAQGGDARAIDDFSLFDQPKIKENYFCQKDGVLAKIDTEKLGMASSVLGRAARRRKTRSTTRWGFGWKNGWVNR